jgi:hypothetical protein
MAVTISEPVYLAPGQWFVEWSSSLGADAHFWIYLNGKLVEADVPTSSMVVLLDIAGTAHLDVYDVAPNVDDPLYPNRAMLSWYGVADVKKYRVEEYVGSWTGVRTFQAEDGDFFAFETRVLEDDTTHQFRVVPIGEDGNEGTPISWDVLMVRHPDAPDVSLTYASGTGNLTVASA